MPATRDEIRPFLVIFSGKCEDNHKRIVHAKSPAHAAFRAAADAAEISEDGYGHDLSLTEVREITAEEAQYEYHLDTKVC